MYKNTNNSKIYYFYDYLANKTHKIGDKDALVKYLAKRFCSYPNEKYDFDTSRINFSGNDSYVFCEYERALDYFGIHYYTALRPYLFFDENDSIIDVRFFKEEIKREFLRLEKEKRNRSWKPNNESDYAYGTQLVCDCFGKNEVCYRFRIDPVPDVGRRRGGPYQHKKFGKIIRMVKHPDFKRYNRPAHYEDVLDYWDYYKVRNNEKSWKQNKKIKKQWQKNFH